MANTPKGWPYPLGTDRVMDGDDAIHALGTALDNRLGRASWAGRVIVTTVTANVPASSVVTFPVGMFTAEPYVCTAVAGAQGAPNVYTSAPGPATATSVTIGANAATQGAAGPLGINVIAHQY